MENKYICCRESYAREFFSEWTRTVDPDQIVICFCADEESHKFLSCYVPNVFIHTEYTLGNNSFKYLKNDNNTKATVILWNVDFALEVKADIMPASNFCFFEFFDNGEEPRNKPNYKLLPRKIGNSFQWMFNERLHK